MITKLFNELECIFFHTLGRDNLRFGKEIFGQAATSELVDPDPTDDVNFVQSTMKPKYIVACLSELHNQSHSSKPIGVVHTYFGSKNVSLAFEEAGSKHMAMIRNPLNRIRSHMEQKLRQTLTANGLKLSFQPSVAEKEKSKFIFFQHQSKLKDIAKAAVEVTLYTDLDNINSCPRDDLLKFEGLFEANETNDLTRNIQKIISCGSFAILQVLKNAKKKINMCKKILA